MSETIRYEFKYQSGSKFLPVRAAYVWLIEPKKREKWNAEPRFELSLMIEPDNANLAEVKRIMAQAAKAEFGTLDGVAFPVKDGTKEAADALAQGKDQEWKRGHILLSTHAKITNAPRLKLWTPNGFVRFEDDRKAAAKHLYPGVYVLPSIGITTYSSPTKCVTVYVNEVLSYGKGEKLPIGRSDEDRYGPAESYAEFMGKITGGASPAEGLGGDEIPF